MSRIIQNNVAVQRAAQAIRQNHYHVIQQNNMRVRMMQQQHLARFVQGVIATPATTADLNRLAEIAENAQQQNLEPDQVEATIRESTPFAALIQLLPKDRSELYMFLTLLVAVLTLIVTMRAPEPTQVLTPQQVKEIIEQVIEHQEQHAPAPPPTTTSPSHCDHPRVE